MNYLRFSLQWFMILVFLFNVGKLKSQEIFYAQELSFKYFDNEHNSYGDDIIKIRTHRKIANGDEFIISNAVYKTNSGDPYWNKNFDNYISYEIKFIGSDIINQKSVIQLETNSKLPNGPKLEISINGENRTQDFEVKYEKHPNKIGFDIIGHYNQYLYLLDGLWFNFENKDQFLGIVVAAMSLNINNVSSPPSAESFMINFNPGFGPNQGANKDNDCPCDPQVEGDQIAGEFVRLTGSGDTHQDTNGNSGNNGNNGNGNNDSNEYQVDDCICEGDFEIWLDENCMADVQQLDTNCESITSYSWVRIQENGEEEIVGGGGAVEEVPPFPIDFTDSLKLVIQCSNCLIESHSIFVDCYVAPECVAEFDSDFIKCQLTVIPTLCDEMEIKWFASDFEFNPPANPGKELVEYYNETSIPITDYDGLYYYATISCKNCPLWFSPIHFNDGNDEGPYADLISIYHEVETVTVTDYCLGNPNSCTIEYADIYVSLNNAFPFINLSSITDYFSFPYCLTDCDNTCSPNATDYEFLDDHINQWLIDQGHLGYAQWVPDDSSFCDNENGFEWVLQITGTDLCFSSVYYQNHPLTPFHKFPNYTQETGPVTLTVLDACLGGSILWSNGESTNTIETDTSNLYNVEVSCPDECVYTADCDLLDFELYSFTNDLGIGYFAEIACDYDSILWTHPYGDILSDPSLDSIYIYNSIFVLEGDHSLTVYCGDCIYQKSIAKLGCPNKAGVALASQEDPTSTSLSATENIEQPTSLREEQLLNQKPEIKIYPNPSVDLFKVFISSPHEGIHHISVYNSNGQSINTFKKDFVIGTNHIQLNMNDHPPGIYFLKIEGSDYIFETQKMVLVKK